ncbi:hypothetical protein [Sinomonas halotolerans]|uniref:Uncharacterized protein n=1 Tax=Sinomonas halotolerans TaxID=1644133 RepID=A0ABU9X0H7_9MICC
MSEFVDVHMVLRATRAASSGPDPQALPEAVRRAAASSGAEPRAQFEGTADPSLSLFWLLRVRPEDADALVETLLALPEVDGAYLKPPDAPAEGRTESED